MAALSTIRERAGRVNGWLLLLLAFCLPLSTTAVTVLGSLLLVGWLIEGHFREKFRDIRTSPVCLAVFAFIGAHLVGLVWSDHLHTGWTVLTEHGKILILPVMLTTVRTEHRWRYLGAFIAGVTVIMLSTYLALFGLLSYADVTPEHLTKKTTHVFFNPMLALAIYLLLHRLCLGGLRPAARWLLLLLVGLMTVDMFITEGRAGQMVFFVLMGLLLAQCLLRRSLLVAAVVPLVLLPLAFALFYTGSPMFRDRVDQARLEIAEFKRHPDTSVGLRLFYWKHSWRIISREPWFGVGTGDFFAAYARINWKFSSQMPFTDNPHNQYVYTAVQLGVFGLTFLLALFAAQFFQARRLEHGWDRPGVAFPLFFLVIMATESYLMVFETGFLFALVSAVLYRNPSDWQARVSRDRPPAARQRSWLILSYRANIPGSACSQHIDDRLPLLAAEGITPILLTGPIGERSERWRQYRAWSLAPSGIRFEVRHFLRRHLSSRWQFKLAETVLLLPVMPFYLFEKILINLESEWSWCLAASVRGALLERRYRPEVLYSTGGSASAHAAALFIHHRSGVPWLAETQDPLVHDREWQRSRMVFRLYRRLERRIAVACTAFIFLTRQARDNARQRVGDPFPGVVIHPGASPALFTPAVAYVRGPHCRFAHFGTLAGSRNLLVFLRALSLLFAEQADLRQVVRVDLFGSLDQPSRQLMAELGLADLVSDHGLIDRREAILAMQRADCLLLIQNTTFFSTETIPSKVYEYLLSGRPVLGLVHGNDELAAMLTTRGHRVAPADDPQAVRVQLAALLRAHAAGEPLGRAAAAGPVLLDDAVRTLVALARGAAADVGNGNGEEEGETHAVAR